MIRLLLAVLLLALLPGPASAQGAPNCRPGQLPSFVQFEELKSWLGEQMGEAVECEWLDPDTGDTLQLTGTGLARWRVGSGVATFTNGGQRWAVVAAGLVTWWGELEDPPEDAEAAERLPARVETPPEPWEVRAHQPVANVAGRPDTGRWTAYGYDLAAPASMWPALELLHTRGYGWVPRTLQDARARVAWGALPADLWGSYTSARNEVVLDQLIEFYPADNVAAVLVHEATHLADSLARRIGSTPADCFAAERRAFEAEAAFWLALHGPRGKPSPATGIERSSNALVYVLANDREAFERGFTGAYEQQCSHDGR